MGRRQINLDPPKPPLCAPVKRRVNRFLKWAFTGHALEVRAHGTHPIGPPC